MIAVAAAAFTAITAAAATEAETTPTEVISTVEQHHAGTTDFHAYLLHLLNYTMQQIGVANDTAIKNAVAILGQGKLVL